MCCTPDHNFKIKYDTSLAYNIYTLLCAVNFKIMIRQGNSIYKWCETGDWLLCGKVKQGIDGEFIEWFA